MFEHGSDLGEEVGGLELLDCPTAFAPHVEQTKLRSAVDDDIDLLGAEFVGESRVIENAVALDGEAAADVP